MSNLAVISTGSEKLDEVLNGGYPIGGIIEICGETASGKSTIALRAIAEAQKVEKVAVYIDVSCSYKSMYAQKLGVDTEKLLVVNTNYIKNMFETTMTILRTKNVDVVVIDYMDSLYHDNSLLDNRNHIFQKVIDIANKNNITLFHITNLKSAPNKNLNMFSTGVKIDDSLFQLRIKTTKINNKIGVQILKNNFGSQTQEFEF